MSTTGELRSAFTAEALSSFEHAMDDVWAELLADGVLSNGDVDEARTRLAQKLMGFASSGRTGNSSRARCVTNNRSLDIG